MDGDLVFSLDSPGHRVVEAGEGSERPLFLSLDPVETDRPDPADPSVLWFGPGVHSVPWIDLADGMTLYLERGAVLRSHIPEGEAPVVLKDWAGQACYRDFVVGRNLAGVSIRGRGLLDLSTLGWHARSPIQFRNCRDIRIGDITIVGSPEWSLALFGCREAEIRNVKIFGHRENSDGIDLVDTIGVRVSDCLIRTGDDAICLKSMQPPPLGGAGEVVVERCIVWNDKVRCFGVCCETRSDIRQVVFRDCDVLHSMATWTTELGSLCLVVCDSATVSDIAFEDIRIEEEDQYVMVAMIVKDFWSKDPEPGHIRDIRFDRIQVPADARGHFVGYDKDHQVENMTIRAFHADGTPLSASDRARFHVGPFVSGLRFL